MSACAPVSNMTSDSIYAVTCTDIRATGDMADFFFMTELQKNFNYYLLFNDDDFVNHKSQETLFGNNIIVLDSNFRAVIDNYYEYIAWKSNLKDPSKNEKAKTIKSLNVHKSIARLYDESDLQYGELEVID